MRLAVEQIGILGQLRVKRLLDVGLVRNLADDFFQNILQRDQTERRPVLVDDDRHMNLVVLELFEQIVDLLMLRHEIGAADQVLPLEVVAVRNIGQHVLYVKHAFHVVDPFLANRNPREARLYDHAADFGEIVLQIERDDIDARLHDLDDFGMHETDDAGQHPSFLDGLVGGHLDGVRQLVDRNIDPLLGHALVDVAPRTDQHISQRTEDRLEQKKRNRSHPGNAQGVVRREYFGHDLAEKQQQKRHDDRLDDELQPGRSAEIRQRIDQSVG